MELLEARRVGAQIDTDNPAARRRVGERRTVAEKIRKDMQTLGEQRGPRQAARAGDDVLLQSRERVRFRAGREFAEGRMRPQQMVNRRPERRLTAFDQPLIGRQRRIVWSPERVDESRLV